MTEEEKAAAAVELDRQALEYWRQHRLWVLGKMVENQAVREGLERELRIAEERLATHEQAA
jgi:hypothetical protein